MVLLWLSCFNMFQESLNLSTGQYIWQCSPCSIIFKMKLFITIFMHDDNVSHVCIANEILACQCDIKQNICVRFLALIVKFLQFVFSISLPKKCTCTSKCGWLFCISVVKYQNITKSKLQSLVKKNRKWLFKKPTADCCFNFLFKFPLFVKEKQYFNFPTISSQYICPAPIVT